MVDENASKRCGIREVRGAARAKDLEEKRTTDKEKPTTARKEDHGGRHVQTATAMCGALLEPPRLALIRAVFFATSSHCRGNVIKPITPNRVNPGIAIVLR